MSNGPETPCDFAKRHYFNVERWLTLWNILLYVFGASIVLFLVAAVLLFIRSTWLPGALTTLGTIAGSAAISWVVKQRVTAGKDEQEAQKRIEIACKAPEIDKQGVEETQRLSRLRVLARKSLRWSGGSSYTKES